MIIYKSISLIGLAIRPQFVIKIKQRQKSYLYEDSKSPIENLCKYIIVYTGDLIFSEQQKEKYITDLKSKQELDNNLEGK